MTTFVLPCGTSILDNLPKLNATRNTTEVCAALGSWADHQQIHKDAGWCAGWLRDGPTVLLDGGRCGTLDPIDLAGFQPLALSSELAGLQSTATTYSYADGRVVLLASDTHQGVLGAGMVATVLCRTGWSYWPDPPYTEDAAAVQVGEGGGTPTVEVVRIPGLDVATPAWFSQAMQHLGQTLAWTAGTAADRLVLHIAGGFKATLPLLCALAEYLRAAIPTGRLEVYCKHESGDDALQLPLRRTQIHGLANLLRTIGTVSDVDARFDHLDGFAFDTDTTGTYALTPLGAGMLAMLDEARIDRSTPEV